MVLLHIVLNVPAKNLVDTKENNRHPPKMRKPLGFFLRKEVSINDFRLVIKHTRQSHLAMQVSQRLMGTVEGKVRGNDITLSWVSFLEGFQFHLHVWICLLRLDKRSQKEIWFNLIRQVNCLKNHMGCFVLHKQIKTPNPNKMPKSTVFAHFFFLFGTFLMWGF